MPLSSQRQATEVGDAADFITHPAPLVPSREKFRDIQYGPFSLHRLFAVLYYTVTIAALYYAQYIFFPAPTPPSLSSSSPSPPPPPGGGFAWTLFGALWLFPLAASATAIAGNLWFRHNVHLDDVPPMPHRVVFRIVSRGINAACLLSTIQRCQREMRATPLFPYLIEVVTDADVFVPPRERGVAQLRVPRAYATPRGSLFKARALHYAATRSAAAPPDAWVLHLDEESHLTSSAVKGVAAFVARCERAGDVRRVGQGTLLYHRSWRRFPLLTLADMRRTGDDIGQFFLQHNLGWTIVGLHGSFVLARADTLLSVGGFDVGPDGSVTEDAWWILVALAKGVRPAWVDGYVEEQSTQSVSDFLRQRKRWHVGLVKTALLSPVPLRFRALFALSTAISVVSPLWVAVQIAFQVAAAYLARPIAASTRVCMCIVQAAAFAIYLFGLVPNMREHGTPWVRVPLWIALSIIFMPVFFVLELTAVTMAILDLLSNKANEFYVVEKSALGPSSEDKLPLRQVVCHGGEQGRSYGSTNTDCI